MLSWMSCSIYLKFSSFWNLAMFFASPVIKLSITITLSASIMIFSIRFEPIKPAPPVIK